MSGAMGGDAPLAVLSVKSQEKSAAGTQQTLAPQLCPAQHPPPAPCFQQEEAFNKKMKRDLPVSL